MLSCSTRGGAFRFIKPTCSRKPPSAAEQRRAATDAAERLPPYRARLGAPFPFAGEIEAKRQELDAINASLAANNDNDRHAERRGNVG